MTILLTTAAITKGDGVFTAFGDSVKGMRVDARLVPLTLTDTTIVLTGLNSTSALACDGATKFQMIFTLGTAATAATLQLQGSQDNSTWYSMGSALLGIASTTQTREVVDHLPQYIRATVSIIGVTIGAGYSIVLRAT